jgi:transposase
VGIDVASAFSYVAMLAPDGELIRKPFRIDHNAAGFKHLTDVLQKEEKRLNKKPIYFVESTGIFHLPLFCFLRSNDLKGFVLNPLCVHSTKNHDIRKVKNDKKDAEAIARLAKYQDVKVSLLPPPHILSLRMLVREYFALADNLTDCKQRFTNDLHLLFPGFTDTFADPCSAAAFTVLNDYPSLQSLQAADRNTLANQIAEVARRSRHWAQEKIDKLFQYSPIADAIGLNFTVLADKIHIQMQSIESLTVNMAKMKDTIQQFVQSSEFPKALQKNIELLDAMPGVGFLSAVTVIAEIGDVSKFSSAKALVAFFGLDPTVKQSGNFTANRVQISKRGTRLGRRVLFIMAMASIRNTKKGDAINPVLRAYYKEKTGAKKNKVALVAIMHKLVHYIFAILRDQKPYEVREPKDHQLNHLLAKAAAA